MIFDILLKNVRVTVSMSRFFDLDLCPEIFLGSKILLLFGNQIFENYLDGDSPISQPNTSRFLKFHVINFIVENCSNEQK